ncbi:MAG: radical SAM protein [Methanomassiliicoccales archaeon]|nr:radical SAM protein [Methanomassiliicoccales archaeon]
MSFHSITYNEKYRFATLHNYGCTFRCAICSYKLRSGANGTPGLSYPKPKRFLTVPEMKKALQSVSVDTVYFMGGEPTCSKELPEMLEFIKNEIGAATFLGHTNGSQLPIPNLDGANVGIKAWDEQVHLDYTGRPKELIYQNFEAAVCSGMRMKANIVYIPGYVDTDQIESLAEWIASIDVNIPFHIMGYIPVPGQTYSRPTDEQMTAVVKACRKHLKNVAKSHLTSEEALDLTARDDRFAVRMIA